MPGVTSSEGVNLIVQSAFGIPDIPEEEKNALKTFFLSLYFPVANNWMGEWRKRWGLSKFPVDR